ncbi:MAG TPA: hypothetical protein VNI83_06850 [Vicinamibacterales bacterium]|nr:hypothetical protein [Vicinamibacterales bacterium]
MIELKPLSREAIPAALEKAMRYRLLGEPADAESICHDILAVEPDHQEALVTLLLALTDQFDGEEARRALHEAAEVLPRLRGDYERAYYSGLVAERRGRAHLRRAGPGAAAAAGEWLREAMAWYERAEAVRPPGNDDAILRWNACARMLLRHAHLQPPAPEPVDSTFLE